MNNKKKLIELFIYIAIVIVGIILLITSNVKEDKKNGLMDMGGTAYVTVLDE